MDNVKQCRNAGNIKTLLKCKFGLNENRAVEEIENRTKMHAM